MEAVIKQGQQATSTCEQRAATLYDEYCPLKTELDQLRTDVGLESLDDNNKKEFQFLSSTSK